MLEPLKPNNSTPSQSEDFSECLPFGLYFHMSGPTNTAAWRDWILNAPQEACAVYFQHPGSEEESDCDGDDPFQ